jgi:arylsulfatase A-like enzyme
VPIPKSVESKSLKPVITGKQDAIYTEIYGYFRDTQRMVRNKRYKLIHYPRIDRHQLFDLSRDPHEMRDLSEDPAHQEIFIALKKKLGTKAKD